MPAVGRAAVRLSNFGAASEGWRRTKAASSLSANQGGRACRPSCCCCAPCSRELNVKHYAFSCTPAAVKALFDAQLACQSLSAASVAPRPSLSSRADTPAPPTLMSAPNAAVLTSRAQALAPTAAPAAQSVSAPAADATTQAVTATLGPGIREAFIATKTATTHEEDAAAQAPPLTPTSPMRLVIAVSRLSLSHPLGSSTLTLCLALVCAGRDAFGAQARGGSV